MDLLPIPRLRIDQRMIVNDERELKKEYLFIDGIYKQVLHFMTAEMNRNVTSDLFKSLQQKLYSVEAPVAFYEMLNLFKSGGEWDHKPDLQRITIPVQKRSDGSKLFVTPVDGDHTYLYYYDIWSNIHYGYVLEKMRLNENASIAASYGHGLYTAIKNFVSKERQIAKNARSRRISPEVALGSSIINLRQLFDQAVQEKQDITSVEIGIGLAKQTGSNLTPDQLHAAIYRTRFQWVENIVRFRWDGLRVL